MLVPRAEFLQLGKRVLQVRWEPKITREAAEKLQPATARREPACGSVPSGPCARRGGTLVPREILGGWEYGGWLAGLENAAAGYLRSARRRRHCNFPKLWRKKRNIHDWEDASATAGVGEERA